MKLSEDSILAHGKQSLISQFMQCFLSQLILNRKQKCKASGPKWHIWKLSNLDVLTHTAHFSSPGFKATEWPFLVAAPGFGWEISLIPLTRPRGPSLLCPFTCFSTLWHYRKAETRWEGDNVPADGWAVSGPCGAGGTAGPLRGRGRRPLRVLQGENKWICSTVNRNNWTSISSAPNFSIRRPIWLNF